LLAGTRLAGEDQLQTALERAMRHWRRISGAQALDAYRFQYQIAGGASVQRHRLAGMIVVRHQSNLIARITMQTTVTGTHPPIADSGRLTFRTVLTFSDYGVAVSVRPPAAVSKDISYHPVGDVR
jgi:hypothetical protein